MRALRVVFREEKYLMAVLGDDCRNHYQGRISDQDNQAKRFEQSVVNQRLAEQRIKTHHRKTIAAGSSRRHPSLTRTMQPKPMESEERPLNFVFVSKRGKAPQRDGRAGRVGCVMLAMGLSMKRTKRPRRVSQDCEAIDEERECVRL
jgi:hypothetical protein